MDARKLKSLQAPLKARYREEPEAARTLHAVGGKVQVPCLFIDGEPMYESADIGAWLVEHFE